MMVDMASGQRIGEANARRLSWQSKMICGNLVEEICSGISQRAGGDVGQDLGGGASQRDMDHDGEKPANPSESTQYGGETGDGDSKDRDGEEEG